MSTTYVQVIHTSGYVQNIMYFVRIEHGAQAPWCYIYIYKLELILLSIIRARRTYIRTIEKIQKKIN
jgi:hypothetical protein